MGPYIHHAPWPREFLFAQKGFVCFVLKGVCLFCPHEGFVCFVLKGVCMFCPHEQCDYLGSYRDLFPFLAVLSTILFNIKIPYVSFLILFHSFMSLPTRTKVVLFFS